MLSSLLSRLVSQRPRPAAHLPRPAHTSLTCRWPRPTRPGCCSGLHGCPLLQPLSQVCTPRGLVSAPLLSPQWMVLGTSRPPLRAEGGADSMPMLLPFLHFTCAQRPSMEFSFNRFQPESSCACPTRLAIAPQALLCPAPGWHSPLTIPALGRPHHCTGGSWSDGRNPAWHLPPCGPRARHPPLPHKRFLSTDSRGCCELLPGALLLRAGKFPNLWGPLQSEHAGPLLERIPPSTVTGHMIRPRALRSPARPGHQSSCHPRSAPTSSSLCWAPKEEPSVTHKPRLHGHRSR